MLLKNIHNQFRFSRVDIKIKDFFLLAIFSVSFMNFVLGVSIIGQFFDVAIIILCMTLLVFLAKARLDLISLLLVIRVIFLSLSNLLSSTNAIELFSTGYFASAIVSLLTYWVFSSLTVEYAHKKLNLFIWFSVVATFVLVINSFFSAPSSVSLDVRKYYINTGMGNSNSIAMVVNMLSIFLISINYKYKKLLLLLSIVVTILTYSRGSMVCLFIVLIYYSLKARIFIIVKKKGLIFSIGLVFVILSAVLFAPTLANEIFDKILFPLFKKLGAIISGDLITGTTNRVIIFNSYISRFWSRPLLGFGTLNVEASFMDYENFRPHNFVLEALFHGGIINLLILMCIFVYFFMKTSKLSRHYKTINLAVIYMLAHSFIEPGIFTPMKDFFFWLIIGFIRRLSNEENFRSNTKL